VDLETSRSEQTKWRAIAGLDGIWQAVAIVEGAPLRSVALRLADGRLAVYSPIRGLGREAHRELAAIGDPAIVIAPNHYHNLGLKEYAAAYPGVTVVASAVAAPRLRRRCGLEVSDETGLRSALPGHISVMVPPETKNGELWISAEGSGGRAWVVGDAFFNLARTPRSLVGLLLRILGISPGLRIGSSFRWLLKDRAAYRRWLADALGDQRPTMLIPCHGDILAEPALTERLVRLVEERL
jgi:hypothetical protein